MRHALRFHWSPKPFRIISNADVFCWTLALSPHANVFSRQQSVRTVLFRWTCGSHWFWVHNDCWLKEWHILHMDQNYQLDQIARILSSFDRLTLRLWRARKAREAFQLSKKHIWGGGCSNVHSSNNTAFIAICSHFNCLSLQYGIRMCSPHMEWSQHVHTANGIKKSMLRKCHSTWIRWTRLRICDSIDSFWWQIIDLLIATHLSLARNFGAKSVFIFHLQVFRSFASLLCSEKKWSEYENVESHCSVFA